MKPEKLLFIFLVTCLLGLIIYGEGWGSRAVCAIFGSALGIALVSIDWTKR